MYQVFNQLVTILSAGRAAVLAVIVKNHGSAPRGSGAHMLVRDDGTILGTIGGGALEGQCIAQAGELLRGEKTFALLDFALDANSAVSAGMVCSGAVTVLLHRVTAELLPFFTALLAASRRGDRPILLTFLPVGGMPPRLQLLGSSGDDGVPEELRAEIRRKPRRSPFLANCLGQEVFVEPMISVGTVHLAGAGHVALAVARLAAYVGFAVRVMDDRAEFANRARFPEAEEIRVLTTFPGSLGELDSDDYVIIATRGHLQDREVLADALRTRAGYIGMIGSRRKREAVYAELRREGFTDADFARVRCPIGLPIGAETPEEIGMCIVAELVQVRAGAKG